MVNNNKKAFTLIEILTALIIVSILLIATISLHTSYHRSFIIGGAYLDISSNARLAVDWMTRDIRWARNLLKTWGSYTTSDNCLILEVPAINAAGDVLTDAYDSIVYDHIIYKLDGAVVQRIVDANISSDRNDETKIVAHDISSVAFSSSGTLLSLISDVKTLVEISISLAASKSVSSLTGSAAETVSETLNTTVKLRNRR